MGVSGDGRLFGSARGPRTVLLGVEARTGETFRGRTAFFPRVGVFFAGTGFRRGRGLRSECFLTTLGEGDLWTTGRGFFTGFGGDTFRAGAFLGAGFG